MPKKQKLEMVDYLDAFEQFEVLRDEVLKEIEVARAEKLLSKTLEAELDVVITKEIDEAIKLLEINLIKC